MAGGQKRFALSRRTLLGGGAAVAASTAVVAVAGSGAAAGATESSGEDIVARLLEAAPAGATSLLVDAPTGPLRVTPTGFPASFAFEEHDRVAVNLPHALAIPLVRIAADGLRVTDNRLPGVEDRPYSDRPTYTG